MGKLLSCLGSSVGYSICLEQRMLWVQKVPEACGSFLSEKRQFLELYCVALLYLPYRSLNGHICMYVGVYVHCTCIYAHDIYVHVLYVR